ncbi:MAG: hypothetical protein HGA45_30820 [Chloroflexales bacterium]|nr:hypothetical protein [Chloroflexales bacterium]
MRTYHGDPEDGGGLPPLDPNSDAFPATRGELPRIPRGRTLAENDAGVGWLLSLLVRASGALGGLFTALGGLIAAVARRPLPTPILPLGEALRRAVALRPSGLLELGVLLLLASPFLYLLDRLRRRRAITAARTSDADERR